MDFIITRNLHQITPYIHFQHSDYGATLRPTEVKPKLDRYLIEIFLKAEGNTIDILKDENCFIGISTALNYKMKITAPRESNNVLTNESELEIKAAQYLLEQYNSRNSITLNTARKHFEKNIKKNHSFYFANMVSTRLSNCDRFDNIAPEDLEQMVNEHIEAVKSSFKESVMYSQPLKLEIVCLNETLRKLIDNNIDSFFITHNFGCRQTKGFGSFVTEKFHGNDPNFYKTIISAFGKPFFYFKASGSATYVEALDNAAIVYSAMKKYANSDLVEIQSLKNEIKFKNKMVGQSIIILSYPDTNSPSEKKYIDKYLENLSEHSVCRFPSPVLIKIISSMNNKRNECYVFFIFNDKYQKSFIFLTDTELLQIQNSDENKTSISDYFFTPPSNEEINSFIKSFSDHCKSKNRKTSNIKFL